MACQVPTNKLYHFEIGFPAQCTFPEGEFILYYTKHALKAAVQDRYGDITDLLPAVLRTNKALLVEVELDEKGGIGKLLYRIKAGDGFDLLLAVSPWKVSHLRPGLRVRTVWANKSMDKHRTLRRERYVSRKEMCNAG